MLKRRLATLASVAFSGLLAACAVSPVRYGEIQASDIGVTCGFSQEPRRVSVGDLGSSTAAKARTQIQTYDIDRDQDGRTDGYQVLYKVNLHTGEVCNVGWSLFNAENINQVRITSSQDSVRPFVGATLRRERTLLRDVSENSAKLLTEVYKYDMQGKAELVLQTSYGVKEDRYPDRDKRVDFYLGPLTENDLLTYPSSNHPTLKDLLMPESAMRINLP